MPAWNAAVRIRVISADPMVSATVTTAGGLLMVGELAGDLIVFDADTGQELYRFNTGGSMAGGLVTYAVGDRQHVAAVSGKGSFFFGRKGSATIVVFRL